MLIRRGEQSLVDNDGEVSYDVYFGPRPSWSPAERADNALVPPQRVRSLTAHSAPSWHRRVLARALTRTEDDGDGRDGHDARETAAHRNTTPNETRQ